MVDDSVGILKAMAIVEYWDGWFVNGDIVGNLDGSLVGVSDLICVLCVGNVEGKYVGVVVG